MGLIRELAEGDQTTLLEQASLWVEHGLVLTPEAWANLDTEERATLTVARRAVVAKARAVALTDAGQDLAGARAFAEVDGGVAAARLMAQAAARGALDAIGQRRGEAASQSRDAASQAHAARRAIDESLDEIAHRAHWSAIRNVVE